MIGMVGGMQGALTFALVCGIMGMVLGFWLGRMAANHYLREENRQLADLVHRYERMASEHGDGGSLWLLFVLVFLAALAIIWLF